jgi:hypothetical protein
MSKLLANQIANYNDNGPVEAKEGLNIAQNKPLELGGSAGNAGQYLVSNGSYPIWQDLPTIPDAQVQVDWNATTGITSILNKPALSSVAISGSYNDLINKPTIPPAQLQADWNAISGVTFIKNKPALATVATSGLYSDLAGRPSIPVSLSDFGIGSQDIDFGSYRILFSNVYATLNDLQAINASTYHGMFAHVHATGKAYFAHNNAWVPLANEADLPASVPTTLGSLDDVDTTGVLDGQVLKWNAASSEWQPGADLLGTGGSGGATVTTDDVAPTGPVDGDLWWKSDEGRLKVYYNDANTSQWVDASPPLAQSTNVPVAVGYIFLDGTSPTWTGTTGYTVSGAQPGGAGTDYVITLTFPTAYSARTDYIVQVTYDSTDYVSGNGASIGVARGTSSVVFTPRRWNEDPLSLGDIMVTITNL